MKYRGSCHCGAVAFEVEGEIKSAMSCNCSICQRKGSLLWFVPRETLKPLTPEVASRCTSSTSIPSSIASALHAEFTLMPREQIRKESQWQP